MFSIGSKLEFDDYHSNSILVSGILDAEKSNGNFNKTALKFLVVRLLSLIATFLIGNDRFRELLAFIFANHLFH